MIATTMKGIRKNGRKWTIKTKIFKKEKIENMISLCGISNCGIQNLYITLSYPMDALRLPEWAWGRGIEKIFF